MREETKRDAMDVGMDVFVVKPIELPYLMDKLNELGLEDLPFEKIV
jgi:hypothetical protein